MKLWTRLLFLTAAGLTLHWSVSAIVGQTPAPAAPRGTTAPARGATTPVKPATPAAARGAAAPAKPAAATSPKAGTYFKNVTTSTLKELSVDDFIASMGVISAAVGYDCADCHPGAGTDKVDFAIDTIPQKKTARRMMEMLANINKTQFKGVQSVSCWTCHRQQQERPATSIALDHLYEAPYMEDADIVFSRVVKPGVAPVTPDSIFDKYLQAVGGAEKIAGLKNFVATGVSLGYGDFGGEAEYTVYAAAPNKRTTTIEYKEHPERGLGVWTVDGTKGWVKSPRGFLPQFELIGGELDGAKLEAVLSFPGQIKASLTGWRVGLNRTIDNKDYIVVQGRGPNQYLATLFFDPETYLLRRLIRMAPSPVGHVPVQVDYLNYRDVGGIKFPFEYKFSWLDGKYTAKLKEIKTNVTIDASKFGEAALKK